MFYTFQQYLKKLHMQERAVEEVKLAIKPFYQRRDINKEEYKEILRKAVQKVSSEFYLDKYLPSAGLKLVFYIPRGLV